MAQLINLKQGIRPKQLHLYYYTSKVTSPPQNSAKASRIISAVLPPANATDKITGEGDQPFIH